MKKQDKEHKSDWKGAIIVVFLAAAIIAVGSYLYLQTPEGKLNIRMEEARQEACKEILEDLENLERLADLDEYDFTY